MHYHDQPPLNKPSARLTQYEKCDLLLKHQILSTLNHVVAVAASSSDNDEAQHLSRGMLNMSDVNEKLSKILGKNFSYVFEGIVDNE